MRRFLHSSTICLLAAAVLLAGCATYQFATPAADWQTLIGQLDFTSPKRSIIGETVVRQLGTDQFQLDFLTGPGFPILNLRKDGKRGRAEAAFARVSWQGDADRPPGPLKSWFALPEVFAAVTAKRQNGHYTLHSEKAGFWTAEVDSANGRPVNVKIEFPHTKERFFFHFSR